MEIYGFRLNFIEVCSWGSNEQYSTIGSDNGLAAAQKGQVMWKCSHIMMPLWFDD